MRGAGMVGAIATGLGLTLRVVLSVLRILPGILGPLMLIYGVWLIYEPAGWIVAGLVLWLADLATGRPVDRPERSAE